MYDNKKINLSNSMDTTIGNFSSIYNYEHLDFFFVWIYADWTHNQRNRWSAPINHSCDEAC
jgi:hypothetical protein